MVTNNSIMDELANPVCILGMHRSGSSMIAQLLHFCGLYLGLENDLMEQTEDNPAGHWENKHFVALNDDILQTLDGAWDHPPDPNPGWPNTPQFTAMAHRARGLGESFKEHEPWGWKDPCNSLTLEFWKDVFPGARYVLCLRNPLQTAKSMEARKNNPSSAVRSSASSFEHALDLWMSYYGNIVRLLSDDQYIVTHYESYFYNPAVELRRVLNYLELGVSDEQLNTAIAAITPNLWRHQDSQHVNERLLPSEVVQFYQSFFAQAGPVFSQLMMDDSYQYGLAKSSLIRLSDELIATHQAKQELEAERDTLIADHKTQLDKLHTQVQSRLEELQSRVDTEMAKLVRLHKAQLDYEHSQVVAMRETRAWRLFERWWLFKKRIFPENSRRLRVYYLVRSSFEIITSEGLSAFVKQLLKWLKGERRYYPHLPKSADTPADLFDPTAADIHRRPTDQVEPNEEELIR